MFCRTLQSPSSELVTWTGGEHVGNSYVEHAAYTGLEMKPFLEDTEKQGLRKAHRPETRLES
jgi:hypothetical protein